MYEDLKLPPLEYKVDEVPKILTDIPGPKAKKYIEIANKYNARSTREIPVVARRAKNAVVEDVDGNLFIDMAAAIAVANVGHNNPYVVERIKRALDTMINFAAHDFYTVGIALLAQKLSELAPINADYAKVFFVNSGTESVEAGIKIARHNRGPYFIAFYRAFHGRTMGSLSLTCSKPVHRKTFYSTMPGVRHAPYPDPYRNPRHEEDPEEVGKLAIEFIEDYILGHAVDPEEVAAIVFEPVQGEGGYIVPPKSFFEGLERLRKDYGILLFDDEVQAGMGRTGKRFAIEHFGLRPDIMTLAKALGGGAPIGATIIRPDLDFKGDGYHSSTFGGNNLAVLAALGVIDYMKEHNLPERAAKLGEKVMKRLKEAQEEIELIGDVRGLGLMIGVDLVKDRKTKAYATEERDKVILNALKRGVIFLPCGKSVVRIAPPLTIEEELLMKGVEILIEEIKKVDKERKK